MQPSSSLTPEFLVIAEEYARTAAGRYKARCSWTNYADLFQVGLLAAVESARTYDAATGIDRKRHLWRSIVLAMQNEMWSSSVVATGGTKHNHTKARADAAGISWQRRTDVDQPEVRDDSRAAPRWREVLPPDDKPLADAQLDEHDWCARVRARLVQLAAGNEAAVDLILEQADQGHTSWRQGTVALGMRASADAQLLALLQEKRDN